MAVSLKVRGIGASRHKSEEFAFTTFYMPDLDQGGLVVYACIKCELHLVENLKANMLIGNNIFCTDGFTINLASASAYILSYGLTIIVNAKNNSQFLKCNIFANATTFIPLKSKALVDFR